MFLKTYRQMKDDIYYGTVWAWNKIKNLHLSPTEQHFKTSLHPDSIRESRIYGWKSLMQHIDTF